MIEVYFLTILLKILSSKTTLSRINGMLFLSNAKIHGSTITGIDHVFFPNQFLGKSTFGSYQFLGLISTGFQQRYHMT